jgi:hypothetical protein
MLITLVFYRQMSFATKNKTHACTESLTVTQKIENKSVPYSFARITGISMMLPLFCQQQNQH